MKTAELHHLSLAPWPCKEVNARSNALGSELCGVVPRWGLVRHRLVRMLCTCDAEPSLGMFRSMPNSWSPEVAPCAGFCCVQSQYGQCVFADADLGDASTTLSVVPTGVASKRRCSAWPSKQTFDFWWHARAVVETRSTLFTVHLGHCSRRHRKYMSVHRPTTLHRRWPNSSNVHGTPHF